MIKKLIYKISCYFGFHKVDEDLWNDRDEYDGKNVFTIQVNYCKYCDELLKR